MASKLYGHYDIGSGEKQCECIQKKKKTPAQRCENSKNPETQLPSLLAVDTWMSLTLCVYHLINIRLPFTTDALYYDRSLPSLYLCQGS
jgi:hypothetical protein